MRDQVLEAFHRAFGVEATIVARAPGRIEFIGNHTDYNGGPVAGAAIDRSVWVALAPGSGTRLRFASPQARLPVEADLASLERHSGPASWTNYPIGVLRSLARRGLAPDRGFDFLALSNLPSGSGLSSSAALELASALAMMALAGSSTSRKELALLGREAENEFVGVPCGLLDQGVSAHGLRGHLVFIDCETVEFTTLPLPRGTRFWLFNTHKKHALVDSLYSTRHAECMNAAAAITAAFPTVPTLARASLDHLSAVSASLPPTTVARARHVIEECTRVRSVASALQRGDLSAVGTALTASHRSSQHQFENSTAELDFLVDHLVRRPGVIGARLTGGGFGGAAMAFTSDTFSADDAASVGADFASRFGQPPDILAVATEDGAEVIS